MSKICPSLKVQCLTGVLCVAGASASASAQNLLSNPGFDDGIAFQNWAHFDNAYNEPFDFARSLPSCVKMFGNWSGPYNAAGCYQVTPANPGDKFRIISWWYTPADDHFSGENFGLSNVVWHDIDDQGIAPDFALTTLTSSSPIDTWNFFYGTAVAPEGTASAQPIFLILQPNFEGGAAYLDDVAFVKLPACTGDLNDDGFVDDADFVLFAGSYNILDCADSTMSLGCFADLNGDAYVDDSDFVMFVAGYDALICPE